MVASNIHLGTIWCSVKFKREERVKGQKLHMKHEDSCSNDVVWTLYWVKNDAEEKYFCVLIYPALEIDYALMCLAFSWGIAQDAGNKKVKTKIIKPIFKRRNSLVDLYCLSFSSLELHD